MIQGQTLQELAGFLEHTDSHTNAEPFDLKDNEFLVFEEGPNADITLQ